MPRKLLILAATLVGAHLAQALFLGVSPAGTLHRESASSFGKRTGGLDVPGRVAAGARAWLVRSGRWWPAGWPHGDWRTSVGCITNSFCTPYLRPVPPCGSSSVCRGFSLRWCCFSIRTMIRAHFEPEFLLDFIQIVIVFFFVFLGLNYFAFAATSTAKQLCAPALDAVWRRKHHPRSGLHSSSPCAHRCTFAICMKVLRYIFSSLHASSALSAYLHSLKAAPTGTLVRPLLHAAVSLGRLLGRALAALAGSRSRACPPGGRRLAAWS